MMSIFDRHILEAEVHTVLRKSFTQTSWCISTDFSSVVTLMVTKMTAMPCLRTQSPRDSTNTSDFVDILKFVLSPGG